MRKPNKGGKRYDVTAEQFVIAWSSSDTIEEVMFKTKMPKNAVYSRVNAYRTKKIELKSMRKRKKTLDIDKLNRLAQDTAAKKKEK